MTACGGGQPGANAGGAAEAGAASGSPGAGPAGGGKVLNLYIWSDYLAPNTLADFEKQTGIKVHVSYFDTNETLETRLLAGQQRLRRRRAAPPPISSARSRPASISPWTSRSCRISKTWIRN